MNFIATVSHVKPTEPVFFPKMMTNKNNGMIVLFACFGKGVSLSHGDGTKPGEYSCTWKMDVFEDSPKGTMVTMEVT